MNILKTLFKENPTRFVISFALSFFIISIGSLNEVINNAIFNYIDQLIGPIGGLLMILIFIPFGLLFTMIGGFVFPNIIWFYVGQFFGFFIDGIIIYALLKFISTFKQKKIML